MVSILRRRSYDNSTISSVDKLKAIWRFYPFSLLSLFFFICFVFQVNVKESLDTEVNPNCLLFSQREREGETPKFGRGVVVGWCDGAG